MRRPGFVGGLDCVQRGRPLGDGGARPPHVRIVAVSCAALAILFALLGSPLAAQDVSCHPGDTEVRRVEFIGNTEFPPNELANAIVTTQSSYLQRVIGALGTRRCIDRTELPRDRLRLILFFRARGFPDVQVDTLLRPVRPNVVDVVFRIREGRPMAVTSLTIDGLDSLTSKQRRRLTRNLPLRHGAPFDRFLVQDSRDTLRLRLRNEGYPYAEVLIRDSTDIPSHTAVVHYTAIPGVLAHIGAIDVAVHPRVTGEKPTVSRGAVRSVMGIKPGQLYRVQNLVAATRALLQTDAFQHIRVDIDTVPTSGQPDSLVTVHADVVENYLRGARVGMGWATLDCFRTQGQYTDRNFLGGLDLFRVNASVTKIGIGYPLGFAPGLCPQARSDIYSDTLNYSLSATLQLPVLFGLHLSPSATLFSQRRSEYNAYVQSTPIGMTIGLTRRLSSNFTLSPQYVFQYGRTTAQPAIYCAVFNLCQPQDIAPYEEFLPFAYIGLIGVVDRRDAIEDPHRGSLIQVEQLLGSKYFGSSPRLQFERFTVDAAGYLALPGGGVFAPRIRAGVVVAIGEETQGFIPQEERLYAGGPTTVRGFIQNQLGPVVYIPNSKTDTLPRTVLANGDTVFRVEPGPIGERVVPEGGNWSIVTNLEYRSPRYVRGLLQWVAFADIGQVWSGNITHMHGLLWTPGVGVRAFSPVGPIRLDVGYNPYSQPEGPAYFNAPVQNVELVPLYCVSPGNTIPVRTDPITHVPLQEPGFECPATYKPIKSQTFIRQLTFSLSIGQAF